MRCSLRYLITTFYLPALFFTPWLSFSQNRYQETVNAYSAAFPFEKIYLHTDKPQYSAIGTDDEGRGNFEFVLNDLQSEMKIIVEGMTKTGQPIFGIHTINVEE